MCSGSLISANFVISAARCRAQLSAAFVRLGVLFKQSSTNSLLIEISQRLVHPQYTDEYSSYDIALFQLKQMVAFSQYVHPICLSQDMLRADARIEAIASEWKDKVSERNARYGVSKILLETIPYWDCMSSFTEDEMVENSVVLSTMFCATSKTNIKYWCEDKTGMKTM